jgi:DNA-3-methyladenine glycosylase
MTRPGRCPHRFSGEIAVETFPVLPRAFYLRGTVEVARDLIGKILAHRTPEGLAAGRIVEVEAYLGREDPASHAFRGPTPRAKVMFEEGGRAYVYFSYGVHWCVNVVTGPEGTGGAVLIRALEPIAGIGLMRRRRGREALEDLCSGPGKLTRALGIGPALNRADLLASPLTVREGPRAAGRIGVSTRIGIRRATHEPLRFFEVGNPHVSR